MKKKYVSLLGCCLVLSAVIAYAESDPKQVISNGFYTPSPVPHEVISLSLRALQEDIVLPKLSTSDPKSTDLRARIRADVATTVRFAGKTPKGKGEDVTTEVAVRFEDDGIVVRSSTPPTPDLRGGIKLMPSLRETKRIVLSGIGGTGFVVIIPAQDYSKGGYGAVVLCPRDRFDRMEGESLTREGGHYDLKDSRIRAVEASFRVIGAVATLYSSGRSMVHANAVVEVSPLLLPSKPFIDDIYSQDPEVDVSYYPGVVVEKEGVKWLPFSDSQLIGGIKSSFVIIRSNNKRQDQYIENTVFLQEHNEATDIPKILFWGSNFKASPGYCVSVIERRQGTFRAPEPVE